METKNKNKRDKLYKELHLRALKSVFKDYFGNVGTCKIDNNKIVYHFNGKKIEDMGISYFSLPDINTIKKSLKEIFPNFKDNEINEIYYSFDSIHFYNRVSINAPLRNVIFSKCKFYDGFLIIDVESAEFISHCICTGSINVDINKLKFINFDFISNSLEASVIRANDIEFINSSLIAEKADVNIDSNNLSMIKKTYIYAANLCASAYSLVFNDSILKAQNYVEIKDKNYEVVDANELRCELIKKLKNIKKNIELTQVQQEVDLQEKVLK